MRGADTFTESLSTLGKLEDFVPAGHPLREIRKTADAALQRLGPALTAMYAADVKGGRPSIAPEKLLRAMLLQVLYSVRELRYMGHTLNDNRHGSVASAVVTTADGFAEREAAEAMIGDARQAHGDDGREVTLGADKVYDAKEFIDACVAMNVTPHVAQNTSGRKSAVPHEIARIAGYAISQRERKLIEQGFGWANTVGGIRQVMVRGLERVDPMFVPT